MLASLLDSFVCLFTFLVSCDVCLWCVLAQISLLDSNHSHIDIFYLVGLLIQFCQHNGTVVQERMRLAKNNFNAIFFGVMIMAFRVFSIFFVARIF